MGNLQRNVLRIQQLWRGAIGRRRATEQRARVRCLQRVVRKLVRIRRQNLAHQAWRKMTLSSYQHRPKWSALLDHAGLSADLIAMWKENEENQLEIAYLRNAMHGLEAQKFTLER